MKFVRVITCNKKGGILRIRLASFPKARTRRQAQPDVTSTIIRGDGGYAREGR
jgi:hypothetical protein